MGQRQNFFRGGVSVHTLQSEQMIVQGGKLIVRKYPECYRRRLC